MAQAAVSVRISSGNCLGPSRTLFHWGLFSASKVNGAKSGYVRAHRLVTRVILLCFCYVWHSDKGGVTVVTGDGACERTGLQTVASCWGCTIWSIEPRVSARRGKCAQAKWTYSTWRAYHSVFTCLLSQVVQTGRLPFHSHCGQCAECFYRAGRVNGTSTGKYSQSSKSAQDAFGMHLCNIMQN